MTVREWDKEIDDEERRAWREHSRRWYWEHHDHALATKRAYRETHREQRREYDRRYYQKKQNDYRSTRSQNSREGKI